MIGLVLTGLADSGRQGSVEARDGGFSLSDWADWADRAGPDRGRVNWRPKAQKFKQKDKRPRPMGPQSTDLIEGEFFEYEPSQD